MSNLNQVYIEKCSAGFFFIGRISWPASDRLGNKLFWPSYPDAKEAAINAGLVVTN